MNIQLPVGFDDISKRVRATMANRYSKIENENGETEYIQFNDSQQKAVKHILDHVVKYQGEYLTCFADNKPIVKNDLETTIDVCAMHTHALSRPLIKHILVSAPMSFQRYQYCPAFPRFLKVEGVTTYNTWHPNSRLSVTEEQCSSWLKQQTIAKDLSAEWLEAGLDKHLVFEEFAKLSTPMVWKIMLKMLFGNEHSPCQSETFQEDSKIFTQWFACCVHRPLERVRWSPVIRGAHGIGKGTFQYLAKAVMGQNSVSIVNNLKGVTSQFAGERALTRLLVVDECYSKGDVAMEAFKPIVTDDIIPVERKGDQLFTTRATHNTVIFSNHYTPFKSAETERRWWVPPYRDYDLGASVSKSLNQAFHAEGNRLIRKLLPSNKRGDQNHVRELLCWLKLIADSCPRDFFSVAPKSKGFADLVDMKLEEQHEKLIAWLESRSVTDGLSLAQVVEAADVPQSVVIDLLKDRGFRSCQMSRQGNRKVWTKAPNGNGPTQLVQYSSL